MEISPLLEPFFFSSLELFDDLLEDDLYAFGTFCKDMQERHPCFHQRSTTRNLVM